MPRTQGAKDCPKHTFSMPMLRSRVVLDFRSHAQSGHVSLLECKYLMITAVVSTTMTAGRSEHSPALRQLRLRDVVENPPPQQPFILPSFSFR